MLNDVTSAYEALATLYGTLRLVGTQMSWRKKKCLHINGSGVISRTLIKDSELADVVDVVGVLSIAGQFV